MSHRGLKWSSDKREVVWVVVMSCDLASLWTRSTSHNSSFNQSTFTRCASIVVFSAVPLIHLL